MSKSMWDRVKDFKDIGIEVDFKVMCGDSYTGLVKETFTIQTSMAIDEKFVVIELIKLLSQRSGRFFDYAVEAAREQIEKNRQIAGAE